MESKLKFLRFLGVFTIFLSLAIFLAPDIAEARKGGGRSFGGSRRSVAPKRQAPKQQNKQMQRNRTQSPNRTAAKPSSFGGKRLNSANDYTSKYGTPRKSNTVSKAGPNGANTNYVVHSYGGYGSGLMTGYMMGAIPFMWYTPFHPAFYYSRPYEVEKEDGAVEVYPPTFSFGKLFFMLIMIAVIIFVVRRIIQLRRGNNLKTAPYSSGSFS